MLELFHRAFLFDFSTHKYVLWLKKRLRNIEKCTQKDKDFMFKVFLESELDII